MINVSKKVASACVNNKQYSEDISALASQLQDGTPQIVHSAKIVLTYPGDQAVMEHFDLLKKEWTSTLEQLSGLVDEVIDTGTFIKASGKCKLLNIVSYRNIENRSNYWFTDVLRDPYYRTGHFVCVFLCVSVSLLRDYLNCL